MRKGHAMSSTGNYAWIRLLLLTSLSCTVAPPAFAENGKGSAIPPDLQKLLKWLPEDTETLIGARTFSLPKQTKMGTDEPFQPFLQAGALGGLYAMEEKYLKPLASQKIRVALWGAKHFEVVSKFGSYRSEDCAVIVFENDLPEAARQWTVVLRQGAKEIRKLAGREVFVFPSTTVMQSIYQAQPWQGTYIVLLKPNTVLCASSDRYLEEVLNRMDAPRVGRALPDVLPEWKQVDPAAPAWMLRHFPEVNDRRLAVGVTWTLARRQVRVVYLPVDPASEKAERAARRLWTRGEHHANIERPPSGDVVISFASESPDPINLLWFGFNLYWLNGETGKLFSEQ
jgi:hypothetical protein